MPQKLVLMSFTHAKLTEPLAIKILNKQSKFSKSE